jgi:hypothetical protein
MLLPLQETGWTSKKINKPLSVLAEVNMECKRFASKVSKLAVSGIKQTGTQHII